MKCRRLQIFFVVIAGDYLVMQNKIDKMITLRDLQYAKVNAEDSIRKLKISK